ncbi:LysR substrate-binding domain-containing protein [Hydrogenophaga sp.]|uniref:LysR substrate-binding domain-containing protein n=1 Tax=Hydrogenophaga sp. TaxID=1904254 RepID=UPI002716B853|nr:LysR substrate-binding domain-containing protein [Hydrogenophaga sp.]MDO9435514.1 LysR substrate-binding domain-containing protein [Hydrogenophaga sp.]
MHISQLPLTALRAFELAARHLSFKLAAAELHVTPTAVSHQIQQLERVLGVQLFQRVHRGLVLTPAAKSCLLPLREGFDGLARAMNTLSAFKEGGVLTVSAPPSFTMRLLMPRTHQFLALHPEVDLNITTRMRDPALAGRTPAEEAAILRDWVDASDVVVVYGSRPQLDAEVREIVPLSITLLCSPALLTGAQPLKEPADALDFPWLHDDRGLTYGGTPYWTSWLHAAGVSGPAAHRGHRFTHAALAIEAALRGEGLLVTTPELCRSELASGLLVAPFQTSVRLDASYFLLARRGALPRVNAFADWLEATLSS